MDLIGATFGNYVVRALLGQGGMGAVYAGEHRFLGDRVAIKLLHGRHEPDDGAAQRFFLEARAARDIDHPAIIKILDFGQSNAGELYLVMELLEGRSLGRAIAEGRFGDGGAARVGALAADGLAAAHARGVIHRDLKPDNLFLVATGGVKILDFGIAKFLSSPTRMTDTGAVLGTPYYLAPEQARDGRQVGPATDVYSLGVILFEMVTGRTPFLGATAIELVTAHLFSTPPRPSTLAKVGPELEALILSCLEKEPEARPASMAALRDQLGELADRLGEPARLAPFTSPSPLPGPSSTAVAPPRPVHTAPDPRPSVPATGARTIPEADPAPGRSPAALRVGVLAALIAVLAAAGAVALALSPRRARPAGSAPRAVERSEIPRVVVRSNPPGATVFVDGAPRGVTPAVLEVALPHAIELRLPGYRADHEVATRPGDLTIQLTADPALAAPADAGTRIELPPRHPSRAPTAGKPAPGALRRNEGLD